MNYSGTTIIYAITSNIILTLGKLLLYFSNQQKYQFYYGMQIATMEANMAT